jgi:2-(1,2-epoxy-1,2-dihydrophenyl)acetyl-CoA isomerase
VTTYETLRLDVRDGVAHLELHRPDAANAITLQLAQELDAVSRRLRDDPTVRAVLLTGAGKMFCGGGDVKAFAATGPDLPAHLREITTHLHAGVSRLVRADPPVVAAVQGSAAGAGLGLVTAADLVVAAESAKFVMAYTAIGLTPDGSSTWFLPRIVGTRRALELALTNRVLTAHEALDWGLVTRVVPDGDVAGEAQALAARLAAGPTRSFGAAARLLRGSLDESLETQMERESEELSAAAARPDAAEGLAAFVEKRAPSFTGRAEPPSGG